MSADTRDPSESRMVEVRHGNAQLIEPQSNDPVQDHGPVEELSAENKRLKERLGKQGNEIGELRKQIEALASYREPASFEENPESATRRAIADALEPIQSELQTSKRTAALAAIAEKHGDFEEVRTSEDFKDWVVSSPYKKLLAAYAETNDDSTAAIELLDMYKREHSERVSPDEAIRRDRRLRAGMSEAGSNRQATGEVFSASELRQLFVENPTKYRAMSSRIESAFRDGRIVE